MSELQVGAVEESCAQCGAVSIEGHRAGGRPVCAACFEQAQQSPLVRESGGAGALVPSIVAGGVGALLGAGVWAAIAVFGNLEIGYVAVLVGFLAGWGVRAAAGGSRGQPYQMIAVVWSVLGLVAAKYIIFAHYVRETFANEMGIQVGWFELLAEFPSALVEMASFFDLLWIALAIGAAWRVPAPEQLEMG